MKLKMSLSNNKNTRIKQPLISVVMPVRNCALFLEEALDSIRNQTHTNWELIAVDDASTDSSLRILRKYARLDKRITVLKNTKRKGISISLNRALKQANGAYIARMDADDISLPERFEKQRQLLENNPDIVACGTQAAMIDPNGTIFSYKRFPTDPKKLYKMIMQVVPLQHPTLLARAEVFKQYRYREDLPTAEDMDMLFYLLSKGKITNTDTILYKYRKTDMSNGYHNVKKTFYITFAARFEAMKKYGYNASFMGIFMSLTQCVLISLLPDHAVVKLFEAIRLDPPLWKRPFIHVIPNAFLEFLRPRIAVRRIRV